MAKEKLDTRAIGLDVGLSLMKWLTGSENLHYGDWTGLEVNASNVLAAQEAYTARLFSLLPTEPSRILDIGGGAGVTARKLTDLGHTVEIVVPSAFLAERCRVNAPDAIVHEATFEAAELSGKFDLCLFSESFQYVALDEGLAKCLTLLADGGSIVLADCFRPEGFQLEKMRAKVGGGHRMERFRAELAKLPLEIVAEEDITEAVAPSVEIEQGLFNVVGHAVTRIDEELSAKRKGIRRTIGLVLKAVMSKRSRSRMSQRLMEQTRNRETFAENNRYLVMKLRPTG
ncbi:class I SAM-dependent methyltransferase [Pelagovum pacificum]|uniref:Class I SAM-dependent methyltransferase n=1 Tax=Pelagovum pacificum TaxID=2588711 RepID=A0A5C5GKC6_9RHOB|nr:methyltransferase domain-containing protein [Pelagovum pacificum]QQA42640.1 methyltransferase domain-containing protein [Pelagovum pacificum]TNY34209.1 class I SAM-dependent methyltransferase [Pelagovum pacificum]